MSYIQEEWLMNKLLDALTLSLEQLFRRYAPGGILAARRAVQKALQPGPDKSIIEDLLALEHLQRSLLVAAETAGALKEEISRVAFGNIPDLSGELSEEDV